jgi:DNA polymerase I
MDNSSAHHDSSSRAHRLLLIDGNAIMHRAYHALPPMRDVSGQSVHIVYGFVSVLIKLFHDLHPTHMAVAFDRPGPTFREKLFIAYQQQRPKMEDDFISQIARVHDMVTAFGIPFYEADGFEADDVIGTLVKRAFQEPRTQNTMTNNDINQIIIVTGDRDILQLVWDEKVLLFMPTKGISEGKLYGEKEVVERMGVHPSQIADFKALAGDPSDNYPGVPGIGPKTAVELLTKYKTLKGIYRSLDESKGKKLEGFSAGVVGKLVAGKDSSKLGIELSTIRSDAPIHVDFTAMKRETLNTPGAIAALESIPFPSLVKRISGQVAPLRQGFAEQAGDSKKEEIKKSSQQQELF